MSLQGESRTPARGVRPVIGHNLARIPPAPIPAREAVLPLEGRQLLDDEHPHLDLYPGLAEWWRRAEQQWNEHRSSERNPPIDAAGAVR